MEKVKHNSHLTAFMNKEKIYTINTVGKGFCFCYCC